MHFRYILFIPFFIIVTAVNKFTLDGYFPSFVKILLRNFRDLSPCDNPMPLGFSNLFTKRIAIAIADGNMEAG